MQHIKMNTESGSTSLPLLIFYLTGGVVRKVAMDKTSDEMKKLIWCLAGSVLCSRKTG